MLWRLPAPVRALLVSNLQTRCYSIASRKHADPLRILFCGSDAFSIKSLLALDKARRETPGLIDEIHVAHRPAKPTGRGLKVLREVPIASTAATLSLPTHVFDTFTRWTPPFSYNLVIAVSFGLLVPPRILSAAKYGGLNVHPSLLPDLRGSAPIEHAILKCREHTGVSVQTLHPRRFDEGVVLAQTPKPGIKVSEGETREELGEKLGDIGAEMMIDVLKKGAFVEPSEGKGWYDGVTDYAPKITKRDSFIDFGNMSVQEVLAVNRALGDMWCLLPNGERLVMHEIAQTASNCRDGRTGLFVRSGEVMFRAKCGESGVIRSSTYPGGRKGHGNSKVVKMLKEKAKI
ncbi:Methionyl-tRNA formyltransferase [Didymella keratinophila]|nr:Methionyl-tRNA formyltransferase [Didymella keratinophila]